MMLHLDTAPFFPKVRTLRLNKLEFKFNLGFLGFLAYLNSLFLILFSPPFSNLSLTAPFEGIIYMIFLFVGCGVTFFLSAFSPTLFTNFIKSRYGKFLFSMIPILFTIYHCLIINLFPNPLEAPFSLYCLAWMLEGITIGILVLESSLFFNFLYRNVHGERAGFYAVVGIVITATLLLLYSNMTLLAASIVLFISVTVAQIAFSNLPLWENERTLVTKKIISVSSRFRHITFGFALFSLIIGCLAAYRFMPDTLMSDSTWTLSLSIGFGGLVFGAIWVILRDKASISMTQWMLLPIPVISILVIPFVGDEPRLIINIVLLGCFMCYDIANILAVSNMSFNVDSSCMRLTGFGRLIGMFGTVIGWSLSAVFLVSDFDDNVMGIIVVAILSILVIVALVTTRPKSNDASEGVGHFKERCRQVCEHYGLSQRETEVFMLLAKSRNAQYIEKALFISNHTARTHINHIYHKLGVHSHQELMSVIEFNDEERQISIRAVNANQKKLEKP
jgi:DNA-binding CsgD family transcriptional regulator